MRNFGLAIAVFAMSFTISSIAFVQTNKSSNTQQTRQANAKQQQVRCPVSGKVITNTKNAPRTVYQGKTYYFSCQSCLAEFRKNPQKYVKQTSNTRTVSNTATTKPAEKSCCSTEKAEGSSCCAGDKATAQQAGGCCADKPAGTVQTAAAPANKLICPISGEELKVEEAVRFTYNDKVYYTCCNGCKNKFLKDPETYAKKAEQISALQGKPAQADTN